MQRPEGTAHPRRWPAVHQRGPATAPQGRPLWQSAHGRALIGAAALAVVALTTFFFALEELPSPSSTATSSTSSTSTKSHALPRSWSSSADPRSPDSPSLPSPASVSTVRSAESSPSPHPHSPSASASPSRSSAPSPSLSPPSSPAPSSTAAETPSRASDTSVLSMLKSLSLSSANSSASASPSMQAVSSSVPPVSSPLSHSTLHSYINVPPSSALLAPKVAAICEKGEFITSSPWAQDCLPDTRVLKENQLRFPPFVLAMPRFVSTKDREWFVSQKTVHEYINSSLQCFQRSLPAGVHCPILDSRISPDHAIVFWTDNFVTGRNLLLSDGAFGQYQGCSWGSKYDAYLKEYPSFFGKKPRQWEKLAPMIVVQGWSFQHLIDGVLPRLMQAWEVLQADPNITVLVDYNLPKFPVVQRIWERLLPAERLVVFNPDTIFQGKLWYQSCQSPPFHPYLWKKMRELFGYEEIPFEERNLIVYLGRGKSSGQSFNPGRSVINEDALVAQLESFIRKRNAARQAAGRSDHLELVTFNHAKYPTLDDTIKFFNKAKVLIGPHGGSFYNLLFTPSGTLTIEFMPQQSMWGGEPNFIIWQQATMLDHNYYLLPYPPLAGDVEVDVTAILDIFEREIPF